MDQEDLLYNIMFQLPLADIKSLCVTMQVGNKICHSRQFWHDKMIKDQLMIKNILDYSLERYELLQRLKEKAINDMTTNNYKIPQYVPTVLLPDKLRVKIPEHNIEKLKVSKMMGKYVLGAETNSGHYGAVISSDEMLYFLFTLYDFEHQRDLKHGIDKKAKKENYKLRESKFMAGLIDELEYSDSDLIDELEYSDSSVDDL